MKYWQKMTLYIVMMVGGLLGGAILQDNEHSSFFEHNKNLNDVLISLCGFSTVIGIILGIETIKETD
jgi:hypothetical protein